MTGRSHRIAALHKMPLPSFSRSAAAALVLLQAAAVDAVLLPQRGGNPETPKKRACWRWRCRPHLPLRFHPRARALWHDDALVNQRGALLNQEREPVGRVGERDHEATLLPHGNGCHLPIRTRRSAQIRPPSGIMPRTGSAPEMNAWARNLRDHLGREHERETTVGELRRQLEGLLVSEVDDVENPVGVWEEVDDEEDGEIFQAAGARSPDEAPQNNSCFPPRRQLSGRDAADELRHQLQSLLQDAEPLIESGDRPLDTQHGHRRERIAMEPMGEDLRLALAGLLQDTEDAVAGHDQLQGDEAGDLVGGGPLHHGPEDAEPCDRVDDVAGVDDLAVVEEGGVDDHASGSGSSQDGTLLLGSWEWGSSLGSSWEGSPRSRSPGSGEFGHRMKLGSRSSTSTLGTPSSSSHSGGSPSSSGQDD